MSEAPFTVEVNQSFNPIEKAWSPQIFIKLYTAALDTGFLAAISDRDWKTLCVIALHMDAKGQCYPSLPAIARALGVNKSTASNRIQSLLQFRWEDQPIVAATRERRANGTLGRQVYTILPLTPLSFGSRTPDSVRDSTSSRKPELVTSSQLSKLASSKLGNPQRKRNKIQDQPEPARKQDPGKPLSPNHRHPPVSGEGAQPTTAQAITVHFQGQLRQAGMVAFPRNWMTQTQRRVQQMVEDGWTAEDLMTLIDWCLAHPFWRNKVTTMDKVAVLAGEWQLQAKEAQHGTHLSQTTQAGRHPDSGALDTLVVRADTS